MSKKISELSSISTPTGTETMEVLQSGVNKKMTVNEVADFVQGNIDTAVGSEASARVGADNALQAQIDALPGAGGAITYVRKKVAASGGDYTSITAAINDIVDVNHLASSTNQYILEVFNGTYLEDGPTNVGLFLRDYVHIYGQSETGVIIKNNNFGATGGAEAGYDTIHIPANCTIKNVTLHAFKCKYVVHADISGAYTLRFENVTFQHFGGATGSDGPDIGAGLTSGQTLEFINCKFLGGGVYAHGAISTSGRSLTAGFNVILTGCISRGLLFQDYEEYGPNKITITGSYVKVMDLRAVSAVYDAGANTVGNRGYKPAYTRLELTDNRIDELILDSEALVLFGKIPAIEGFNTPATNKSGGTIAKGYAVILRTDAGEPNSYSNLNQIGWREIDIYDGAAGIFLGFTMESIANDAKGMVQTTGTPSVEFDSSGGAVVYGDGLEVAADGRVQVWSTGDLIGHALEAKSTDGLLKMTFL